MKSAIIQCGHPGSLESLVIMLNSVGYECLVPDEPLLRTLRNLNCVDVVDPYGMARNWGGSCLSLKRASVEDIRKCSLFFDVKGHINTPLLVSKWPSLHGKVIWYRINGGEPADVPDKGPELSPPCPIFTPNQWYKEDYLPNQCVEGGPENLKKYPWSSTLRYVFWPPFNRFGDHLKSRSRNSYTNPICLVHNLVGWGYGDFIEPLRKHGLQCYGGWGSPDGLLNSSLIPNRLATTLCLVHLKSTDSPGYALYEALASACPVVIPERLIHRCNSWQLFKPDINCLTFDRYNEPEPLHWEEGVKEILDLLDNLKDSSINRHIGEAGRESLRDIMWSASNPNDIESLEQFLDKVESSK